MDDPEDDSDFELLDDPLELLVDPEPEEPLEPDPEPLLEPLSELPELVLAPEALDDDVDPELVPALLSLRESVR